MIKNNNKYKGQSQKCINARGILFLFFSLGPFGFWKTTVTGSEKEDRNGDWSGVERVKEVGRSRVSCSILHMGLVWLIGFDREGVAGNLISIL